MGMLTIIIKEISLMLRDKIGLLILFLLPIFLLIIVSITQKNVNAPQKSIKVLLINQDKGSLGKKVVKHIVKNSKLNITQFKLSKSNTKQKAEKEVAKGKYNALIVIDNSLTSDVNKNVRSLSTRGKSAKVTLNSVQLYTDPVLPTNVVNGLKDSVKYLLQSIQLEATQSIVLRSRHVTGNNVKQWFALKQESATTATQSAPSRPNSVQQNAPAWTLFGMFFIVIPLAGQMVRERSMGVIQRIRVAPVPQVTHLCGRVVCYYILNMVQMSLMLIVAVYLLPKIGLPSLNIAGNIGPVYLIGTCASLAAIGFGLLIGTYATSAQQATIFAPFLIVIVAAVSGIFMPMYLMPEVIKSIGEFSPLYWAQGAFIDIFVRNVEIQALLPAIFKLLGFFVAMLVISLLPFSKALMQRKVNL